MIRRRVLLSFPISRDTWFLCLAEQSRISPWDLPPARRNSGCIPIIIRFWSRRNAPVAAFASISVRQRQPAISEPDYPEYDLKKCIGCAQCIAMCPELALQIFWNSDMTVFQEKLVETAAAVWKKIQEKTIVINALLNITVECDCLPGKNPVIGHGLRLYWRLSSCGSGCRIPEDDRAGYL